MRVYKEFKKILVKDIKGIKFDIKKGEVLNKVSRYVDMIKKKE